MLELNRSDETPAGGIDVSATQPLNQVVDELLRFATRTSPRRRRARRSGDNSTCDQGPVNTLLVASLTGDSSQLMGDLEDVAERISHHGPTVPVGPFQRLFQRHGTSIERSAVGLVRVSST